MIRLLFTLLFLGSLSYGIWWIVDSHPEIKDRATQYLPSSSFISLESRFTIKQVMEAQKHSLIKDSQQQFGNNSLLYHPFLLMDVKFTRPNNTTGEGAILWDLIDGEMILNTQTWEKSHGFADCIHTHADAYELKILSSIAHHGNRADRQTIFQDLNLGGVMLDTWLERCMKKRLIAYHEGTYRIHLESPKMAFIPMTHMNFPLITKTSKHPEKRKKNFSISQIIRVAETAFGDDFAIRQIREVYLPVYLLTIQNKDGSYQTTHWNALNGHRLD